MSLTNRATTRAAGANSGLVRSNSAALRGVVASASRMGTFQLENDDDAENLAKQMQFAKGIDPSLGLYAAYAYRDLGQRERIRQMAGYMQSDLGLVLFDIAMLARQLDGTEIAADAGRLSAAAAAQSGLGAAPRVWNPNESGSGSDPTTCPFGFVMDAVRRGRLPTAAHGIPTSPTYRTGVGLMVKELVFVHGRSQQYKDSAALKAEWVEAFRAGLRKLNRDLPIPEDRIRFPYYGQTLWDLVQGCPEDEVAEVIVRGDGADEPHKQFVREFIEEVRQQNGITDEQLREVGGQQVIEKGPQNWEWVQTILKALDRFVPGASGASVALFTNDVYKYLRNPGLQNVVDSAVRQAFAANVPTVVVGHSLGSVVAYNVLRREGQALGWKVPLFVTVGAPLGVKVIRTAMAPNKHPSCAAQWFNALDERDVVALYPLNEKHFPVTPAIENKTNVDNPTPNRHGIIGYLSDPEVARRIHDALIAAD